LLCPRLAGWCTCSRLPFAAWHEAAPASKRRAFFDSKQGRLGLQLAMQRRLEPTEAGVALACAAAARVRA
jgi:hypothetical protein